MQHFLRELKRIEIDNDERCFNGFFSSERYTEHLNKLYSNVDITLLMDENCLTILQNDLEDFMVILDAYLPMFIEVVDNMRHDARISPYLQEEADWYTTLYNIRGAKIYYYKKIMNLTSCKGISKQVDGNIPELANMLKSQDVQDRNQNIPELAKGVAGIAQILGCGKTKANEIIQSGFLKDFEVGYYNGRTPVLELNKWEKLPSNLRTEICKKKSQR